MPETGESPEEERPPEGEKSEDLELEEFREELAKKYPQEVEEG
ncbi:MAG TPA: hypothetical protein VLX56_03120 [Nitrososphaerales archaeon]|nr:hypothetical protein [Nitrososphaerales archaeon]